MSATYSGAPVAGTTDEIRFLLQDTNLSSPIFQDEEIQYSLDKWMDVSGSSMQCAAYLAEIAAAKYAQEVSISSDQTSIAMEQLQQKYEELAGRLRAMAGTVDSRGVGPIVGGNNWDDSFYGMAGRKVFRMKVHDNIRGGRQNSADDSWWIDYEYGGWWEGQ